MTKYLLYVCLYLFLFSLNDNDKKMSLCFCCMVWCSHIPGVPTISFHFLPVLGSKQICGIALSRFYRYSSVMLVVQYSKPQSSISHISSMGFVPGDWAGQTILGSIPETSFLHDWEECLGSFWVHLSSRPTISSSRITKSVLCVMIFPIQGNIQHCLERGINKYYSYICRTSFTTFVLCVGVFLWMGLQQKPASQLEINIFHGHDQADNSLCLLDTL